MRDLKNMGVNTIRTWGVDDAQHPDAARHRAAQQGIKVIVGHWLNQGADYVNDTAYKNAVKAEIVARVNALKNQPGRADVGRRQRGHPHHAGPRAGRPTWSRRAGWRTRKFVNEVARGDPRRRPEPPGHLDRRLHRARGPTTRRTRPALDLLAVNSYGAIGTVKPDWIAGGYTKPYILTEAGPDGEWEVPNDVNGVPDRADRPAEAGRVHGELERHQGATRAWRSARPSSTTDWRTTSAASGSTPPPAAGGGSATTRCGRRTPGRPRRTPRRRSPSMTVGIADRGAGRRHVHGQRRGDRPAGRPDPLQPDGQRQAHHRQPRLRPT